MAYLTSYALSIEQADEQAAPVALDLAISLINKASEFAQLGRDGESDEPVSWYSWEYDMRSASAEVKGVVFKLHGEGGESGDIWDSYFLDGKMQRCDAQVVIPPFDPAQLE